MRIYSKRFYEVAEHPGISGFQRWDKLQVRIVTGLVARRMRSSVLSEFDCNTDRIYRLDDGHLPDYQPRADASAVISYLTANPYSSAYELTERDA